MKLRYAIIGLAIILISFRIPKGSFYFIDDILETLTILCLGLIIYLIIRNIFRAIKSIVTKGSTKKQSSRKLQSIDRALDEIESTLDAMTEAGQEDGKITPIWGAGTKKDR